MDKVSQKDIKKFAKELVKVNTEFWNFVCLLEQFTHSDMFLYFSKLWVDEEPDKTILLKLLKAYKETKKNDEEFIDVGIHDRDIQDWDCFREKLEGLMESENIK